MSEEPRCLLCGMPSHLHETVDGQKFCDAMQRQRYIPDEHDNRRGWGKRYGR